MLFMRPERALEKTVSYSEDRKGWRGKDAGPGSCSHGDLPYKRWERGFLSPKGGGPRFLADEGLENFLKGERGGHSLRSSAEAQTTQHETSRERYPGSETLGAFPRKGGWETKG